MFLVREVGPEDLDSIYDVAQHLDTVNLPAERAVLESLIQKSCQSFSGALSPAEKHFVFVLVDSEAQRVVGTSMIHAQHGTRKAPHIFFDVLEEERYSETLDKHVHHLVLRIGYNYHGPTEIGGLILLPEYRGSPLHLGKVLSYVRFLFIGIHREWFRDEVLSELLPPLEPDGTSRLWENLGRHFTGMSYQEADRLSQHNKEFIRSLFPQDPLYVCLLPEDVRQLVGTVGTETKGVEKMLRAIGFRYAKRIDPFDGGPHFVAKLDEILLLRWLKKAKVSGGDPAEGGPWGIVGAERSGRPHFSACGTRYSFDRDEKAGSESVRVEAAAREALGISVGDTVWLQPAE